MVARRISVIVPTLNASATLERCLGALRRQTVIDDVELLVVDGGSTDGTRAIAAAAGATVIDNPAVVPEQAKALGLRAATGEFGVFLDADEEIVLVDALERRRALLEAHADVHNVMTAGMRRPPGCSPFSDYLNRYGDPFSFFLYRLDGGDMVPAMLGRYRVVDDGPDGMVLEVPARQPMPICDAGSHFFRLSRARDTLDLDDPSIGGRLFALLTLEHRRFGVRRGDLVLHHSDVGLMGLWRKIDWRVRSNVHGDPAAATGHSSRVATQPLGHRLRQLAFLPYALTVIPAVVDGVLLARRHRSAAMLAHGPLAVMTAVDILLQVGLRAAGRGTPVGAYGARSA